MDDNNSQDHILQEPIESEISLPNVETFTNVPTKNSRRNVYIGTGIAIVLALAASSFLIVRNSPKKPAASLAKTPAAVAKSQIKTTDQNIQGVLLDLTKNYGNKYSNGVLPVGDGKYVSDAAKPGYVFACSGYAGNLTKGGGGAGSRGPWFLGTTQYDINKKLHVQGNVMWQTSFSNAISGSIRTITSNDLPTHPTGVFPISASDPAYAYDRNPNSIKSQTLSYSLNASPSYGSPQCIGGEVGIMLSGAALFNGFDAGGRDAGAWEVQDGCGGHPQNKGEYHYHTLSSCVKDISVKTVIGFALDGFAVTGPQLAAGNVLSTSDLDECHGLSSQIILDGKNVMMYHYVMTQDFPYSISCFRSTAIQPPGLPAGTKPPGV